MNDRHYKLLYVGMAVLVLAIIFLSGPRASVLGEISSPTPTGTYLKTETIKLNITLTASSGDVINLTEDDVSFIIQNPLHINSTVDSSDITITGDDGSEYAYGPGGYAYQYGYSDEIYVTSDYTTEFTGDHVFYAEVNYTHVDDVGNLEEETYSNSTTFSVEEEAEEEAAGGGGAAPVGVQTTWETETFSSVMSSGDTASFTIGTERHSARLLSIGTDHVILSISSEPVLVTIRIGETKNVDVDNDGTTDISITLENIVAGKAYLTFEKIVKKVVAAPAKEAAPSAPLAPPAGEIIPEVPIIKEEKQVAAITPLRSGVTSILALIAIAAVAYLVVKSKKRKR